MSIDSLFQLSKLPTSDVMYRITNIKDTKYNKTQNKLHND